MDVITAIVTPRGSSGSRTEIAEGSQRVIVLLGIAKENVVALTEAVVDSNIVFVRVVDRGSILNEVLAWIDRISVVRSRRICLKERLHRRIDQRGRNLVARRNACWRRGAFWKLQPRSGIGRQGLSAAVAVKGIPQCGAAACTRREWVEDLIADARNRGLRKVPI